MKKRAEDELDDFGRFSDPALLILISLADGPKHGYAMYVAITRLESRGLIAPVGSEDRRNPYRLTALGERALRARLAAISNVARIGHRRLANA